MTTNGRFSRLCQPISELRLQQVGVAKSFILLNIAYMTLSI